jgi:hypothetical protein
MLRLNHPHPPQALLTALLLGKQAPAAAAAPAVAGSIGLEPSAAAAGAAGRGQQLQRGRNAGVVGWLRAVTSAADWCCWALDQR